MPTQVNSTNKIKFSSIPSLTICKETLEQRKPSPGLKALLDFSFDEKYINYLAAKKDYTHVKNHPYLTKGVSFFNAALSTAAWALYFYTQNMISKNPCTTPTCREAEGWTKLGTMVVVAFTSIYAASRAGFAPGESPLMKGICAAIGAPVLALRDMCVKETRLEKAFTAKKLELQNYVSNLKNFALSSECDDLLNTLQQGHKVLKNYEKSLTVEPFLEGILQDKIGQCRLTIFKVEDAIIQLRAIKEVFSAA